MLTTKQRQSKWRIGMFRLGTLVALFGVPYLVSVLIVRQTENAFPPMGQFVTVEGIRLH